MIEITIPVKYNISRVEWAAIRAQLVVLGCPSKAVPKRYATLKHRLSVLYCNAQPVWSNSYRDITYKRHLGWFAQWMVENNLMIAHLTMPSRYTIATKGVM